MNFKDFYEIVSPVPFSSPAATPVSELSVEAATRIVFEIAQNSFGKLEGVQIEANGHGVSIATATREIDFDITATTAYHLLKNPDVYLGDTLPIVEIAFGWNRVHRVASKSPKDNQRNFSVGTEVDKETIPLMHAFKACLSQLRNYPIAVVYTAVYSRPIGGPMINRRGGVYQRMFNAVGYIQTGQDNHNPIWLPPLLIRAEPKRSKQYLAHAV